MQDVNGEIQSEQRDESNKTQTEQISDLLLGMDTGESEEEDQGAEGAGEESGDQDFEDDGQDPAGQDERSPGDKPAIDYSLEIPMPSGEKVTVGQLKDLWQTQNLRDLEITQRENGLIAKVKELEQMAEIAGVIPPQVQQQIQEGIAQHKQAEFKKLLEVIPGWKEQKAFEQGRESIIELAKEYGLQEAIGSIVDHRAIKLLKDFADLRAKVAGAKQTLERIKEKKPEGKPAGKPSKISQVDLLIKKAKTTNNQADQNRAIAALLTG